MKAFISKLFKEAIRAAITAFLAALGLTASGCFHMQF